MEILEEKPITFSEAREILEKKAEDKRYEIVNALDHLRKFASLSVEEVNKLKEELRGIGKLTEEEIVEICNILPKSKDELKVVLHKNYTKFEEADLNKIVEIVKKFA